jgi:hypothetical protein
MPLFRRRPLLRAAAVGGGAYMAGKHRERAQAEDQAQAYQSGQQSATAAAPAQAPSPGLTTDDAARLQEIAKLHEQGILTDEEFAQQKSIILGAG